MTTRRTKAIRAMVATASRGWAQPAKTEGEPVSSSNDPANL